MDQLDFLPSSQSDAIMVKEEPTQIDTEEYDYSRLQLSHTPEKERPNASMKVPCRLHNPPPGSIEFANQYLWDYVPHSPPYMPPNIKKNRKHPNSVFASSCTNANRTFETEKHEKKRFRLNLQSRKDNTNYSSLPYITPPNSPISGRRNIAPLGVNEFDYHKTLETGFQRPSHRLKFYFHLVVLLLKSLFVNTFNYFQNHKCSKHVILGLVITLSLGVVANHSIESTHVRENEIAMQIISQVVSSKEALKTAGSAQFEALKWVAKQDPMQLSPDDERIIIRYALAVFYHSMTTIEGRNQWDHNTWLSGHSVCQWKGVLCTHTWEKSQYAEVIGLNLIDVQGRLPGSELAALKRLQWLHLGQNNQISGTLPPEVGLLTELVILSLGNNQITGSIPPQITSLTSLELLGLQNNRFNSTMPSDIGNLSNLAAIYLDSNRISGYIPASLGHLKDNLVDLRLNDNLLKGSIPSEIGLLTQLHKLYLDTNKLNGPLPSQLSNMNGLKLLHIHNNNIQGRVPSNVCELSIRNDLNFKVDCDKLSCSCCDECGT